MCKLLKIASMIFMAIAHRAQGAALVAPSEVDNEVGGVDPLSRVPLGNGCNFFTQPLRVLNCSSSSLDAVPVLSAFLGSSVHVWLDHNLIQFVQAGAFDQLREVKMLFLDHNEITTIEDGAFDNLQTLNILSLSNNKLKKFPANMADLPSLEMLDASYNNILTLPYRDRAGYGTSLRWLSVAYNRVLFAGCGFFQTRGSLNYLAMQENPSVCYIDQKSGEIVCKCARPSLQGIGYCSKDCKIPNFGAPSNTLGSKSMDISVSWGKVASLLAVYRNNHSVYQDNMYSQADGSDDNNGNDEGSDKSSIIALLSTVAVFAIVAVVVLNVMQSRRSSAAASTNSSSDASSSEVSSTLHSKSYASTLAPSKAHGYEESSTVTWSTNK